MANTKIPSELIPDNAVTSAKIADDAVGADQLKFTATGGFGINGSVKYVYLFNSDIPIELL